VTKPIDEERHGKQQTSSISDSSSQTSHALIVSKGRMKLKKVKKTEETLCDYFGMESLANNRMMKEKKGKNE
jgi:hypothetical protein